MTKQLGIIKKFDPVRGFGFIRDALTDFEGRIVPATFGRQNDHFVGTKTPQRSGFAPDDFKEGAPVKFSVASSTKYEGRTVAFDIELIEAG